MRICVNYPKTKQKENPCLTIGTSLPFNHYKCFHTCMYYFNIAGNMNNKSQIYLVAFVNDENNKTNKNLILKNNQWIEYFNNHTKLLFPKQNHFHGFGSYFMVCVCPCVWRLFVFVFFPVFFLNRAKQKTKNGKKNIQRNQYKNTRAT